LVIVDKGLDYKKEENQTFFSMANIGRLKKLHKFIFGLVITRRIVNKPDVIKNGGEDVIETRL
jgi:hypothetical protein